MRKKQPKNSYGHGLNRSRTVLLANLRKLQAVNTRPASVPAQARLEKDEFDFY